MPLTGRHCTWCGIKELRPDNIKEFDEWIKQPNGCCAPDGDGHLWIFSQGYSWKNPPAQPDNKECKHANVSDSTVDGDTGTCWVCGESFRNRPRPLE